MSHPHTQRRIRQWRTAEDVDVPALLSAQGEQLLRLRMGTCCCAAVMGGINDSLRVMRILCIHDLPPY